jgi:hypothetical protein
MESICLYTSLFTLSNKLPKENEYCLLLIPWLHHAIKYAGLTTKDSIVVVIDPSSMAWVKENVFVRMLMQRTPVRIHFVVAPTTPSTLLDGCLQRYATFPYHQTHLLYLDIDILIKKSIAPLLQRTKPDTLYVHWEGPLYDTNYGAHLQHIKAMAFPLSPGASSGKFLITSSNLRNTLFASILDSAKQDRQDYYTLDQPYYNAALYTMPTLHIDGTLFTAPSYTCNLNGYTKECIFADFMGEPGRGFLHLEKVLGAMCVLDQ